ncbi:MAG: hypothetical protein RSE18_12450 [Acinetobacter sp.]
MKANEFVKEFGLKITKKILSNAPDWAYEAAGVKDYANKDWSDNYPMGAYVKIDDLKRLVKSHELVEAKGGIKKAKKEADCLFSHDIDEAAFHIYNAIADVESCL